MAWDILLLAVGIIFLVKFSDVTIERAAHLSKLTGISHFAIGFIFIAVSTSLPEFSIAVISALAKENDLSLGNLVGANITLLTLIIGLLAFVGFRPSKKDFLELDLAVIITSIVALFLLATKVSNLAVGIFAVILFYVFSEQIVSKGIDIGMNNNKGLPVVDKVKASLELVASVLVVVASAYIVTQSAINISKTFGIAETILGATILSIGTTLPELSVNTAAIRKNDIGLAVGDTVGSIVTNLTLILGISSIINPIIIGRIESFILALFVLVSLVFLFLATRLEFDKWTGVILIAMYIVYLAILTVML